MADETAKEIIIDAATGEITERNLTSAELAETKASADFYQAKQEAKAAARESALAKLAELGLTAEEIAAL